MLQLVLPHGNGIRLVEQDIRRHQDRIGEEARVDRIDSLALLLELRHAVQFADRSTAGQNPGQLGVLGHVRLDEEVGLLGIDAAGQKVQGSVLDASGHFPGFIGHRQGVVVHDRVEALSFALHPDPVEDGPGVVADMDGPGGLDSGKDSHVD